MFSLYQTREFISPILVKVLVFRVYYQAMTDGATSHIDKYFQPLADFLKIFVTAFLKELT